MKSRPSRPWRNATRCCPALQHRIDSTNTTESSRTADNHTPSSRNQSVWKRRNGHLRMEIDVLKQVTSTFVRKRLQCPRTSRGKQPRDCLGQKRHTPGQDSLRHARFPHIGHKSHSHERRVKFGNTVDRQTIRPRNPSSSVGNASRH